MSTRVTLEKNQMTLEDLVHEIRNWESTTFSASGKGVKEREAQQIARRFINIWFNNHFDGLMVGELLDEIREKYDE